MTQKDPPRLLDDPTLDAPAMLRTALGDSGALLPSAAQLEALTRRLGPLLGPVPGGSPPAPPHPSPTAPPAVPPAALPLASALPIAAGTVVAAMVIAMAMAPTLAPPLQTARSIEWAPIDGARRGQPVDVQPSPPEPAALEVSVAELPSASAATSAPPRPRGDGSSAAQSAPDLPNAAESEADMLARAQSALASSPAQALAIAADHARIYPRGNLAQEREMVAITALVQLGRSTEARERAARFQASYPGSAHLRRLRTLVPPEPE